jgi:hypothetical protein
MKTGRPEYYIPSPSTVSRDVRLVFLRTRERIAKMLNVSERVAGIGGHLPADQETEGKLSFATDAWTSPNHKAYVALTVHLEHKGKPLCMVLDIVEVAKSHSGINLATAFASVLKDFRIEHKVSEALTG